ncbi:uncharacterized protein TNCV_4473151 [Trichonephila clavipes]|uniref:Uncharacterized protein n=1 Tax=Trichonephila clavipes TaxID=2585209 RepID=A0A8X6VAQ8_TRICX|nr:uncharacterized protein TNCV_4473151 [Trichonephila clavipes]
MCVIEIRVMTSILVNHRAIGTLVITKLSIIKCTEEPKNWYRHAYANEEVWNQSEYSAVVDKAYIRPRVSGTVVGYATAATMAGYQDLSEFEHDVVIGARENRYSISEAAMKF